MKASLEPVRWRLTPIGHVMRHRTLEQTLSRCVVLLTPLLSYALPMTDTFAAEPETPQTGSPTLWLKTAVIVALVLLGGVFAGLTLGLMGLDVINLQVLSVSGTLKEQQQATTVLNLLNRGRHWVLVVLLLSNVIVNESLPIFLDDVIGGGVWAVVISTSLIVVFGEIIPQSVCARYGLAIGAKSAPFVLVLMWLEYPVAYPIAKLLDWVLGQDEGTTYKKAELKTFVGLHRHLGDENLEQDEVTIISAVLELSEKSIRDIMTPIEDVYTLSADDILDAATVEKIAEQGYSRVPVWQNNRSNFVGMLLIKKLISYDPEDAKPVKDFQLSVLPEADPEMNCLAILNFFQEGRSHILLVSEHPGEDRGAIGVVTLEDVIEEVIGEEIVDETDVYVDVKRHLRVVRRPNLARKPTQGLAPILKEAIDRRREPLQDQTVHAAIEYQQPPVLSKHVVVKGGAPAIRKPRMVVRQPFDTGTPEILSTSPSRDDSPEGERQPLLKKIHDDGLKAKIAQFAAANGQ